MVDSIPLNVVDERTPGSIVLVGAPIVVDSNVELGEIPLVVDSSEECVTIPAVVDSKVELGTDWAVVNSMLVNVLETTVRDSCEEDTTSFVLVCLPVEDWLVDGALTVVLICSVEEVCSVKVVTPVDVACFVIKGVCSVDIVLVLAAEELAFSKAVVEMACCVLVKLVSIVELAFSDVLVNSEELADVEGISREVSCSVELISGVPVDVSCEEVPCPEVIAVLEIFSVELVPEEIASKEVDAIGEDVTVVLASIVDVLELPVSSRVDVVSCELIVEDKPVLMELSSEEVLS